jgi:hypothetical protein
MALLPAVQGVTAALALAHLLLEVQSVEAEAAAAVAMQRLQEPVLMGVLTVMEAVLVLTLMIIKAAAVVAEIKAVVTAVTAVLE